MTRSFHTLLRIMLSVFVLTAALVSATRAQDEPSVDLTIETVTLAQRTGTITVTGTVTCAEAGTLVGIGVEVIQGGVRGGGTTFVEACGPAPTPFSVTFAAFERGRFHPGPARLRASAGPCIEVGDSLECVIVDQVQIPLRLLPG